MITQILNDIKDEMTQIIKDLGVSDEHEIIFEIPREASHGDYSTNIAMRLARAFRKNPREIANEIVSRLDQDKLHLTKCEVAEAGFINFFLDRKYLSNIIFKINEQQEEYGMLDTGKGTKINIEFVSANPTGYLHIGHGRGAAYGDSLARIYKKLGYDVSREHYVNDAGNQIYNLAQSIYARYRELHNLPFELGEDAYHGPEIIEIAKKIQAEYGDKYLTTDYLQDFKKIGVEILLDGLRHDLKDFNVEFDIWFSEQSLYDNGDVEKTLKFLQDNNFTYEKDGAIWLKSSEYGDEKDRVLVKSDGTLTYLTPDIAYHMNKLSRGYDYLIDVFGADHHGYVPRLKAAIAMIGGNPNMIDVEILQMVRVIQNGEELKLSKRSGKAITLRDLMDEVGTDALRFMYISKALSTHMDLDLDLAIKNSNENPVYYVQYAYARICSLFRNFEELGHEFELVDEFKKLDFNKNDEILLTLLRYPEMLQDAASTRLPHKVAQYVMQLAANFHSFYSEEKIITDDLEETLEKLTLLKAVQIVLKDALSLIGVGVKERM